MGHLFSFEPPPADYPNYLAALHPERRRLPSARWLLLLLVVLCLLPRVAMALRIPSIAGDGVNYVNAARALEGNNFRAALWEGGLNIYLVILMLLHRSGLDWETAATLWGVTISCLVVLPLWGWVRRQFDDRVALVACLLYVVHPKFIMEGPELMRDPTFWFFFILAIYWLWRAVTEVRYGWFIASGAAITLASLTRIEGLFLLVPLFLWTFWRWLALETGRWKLLAGAVLCVGVFPLLLALVNVVWLYGHSDWALIRLSPLARVWPWLASMLGYEPSGGVAGSGSPPHIGRIIWRFFPTMTRGLSPAFALLMFGGIWGWRRVWSRRDHQAMFCTAMVMLCGIWVQAWSQWYLPGNINARYALPIVLMASPFAALGLLALAARGLRIAENRGWQVRGQRAAIVAIAALVVVPGMVDIVNNNRIHYGRRRMMVEVGRWARRESPTPPVIVGPWDFVLPISYYAQSNSYARYRYDESEEAILELIAQNKADLVLLRSSGQLTPERCERLVDHLKRRGFEPVRPDSLPDASGEYHVLVRANWLEAARRSTSQQ